MFVSSSTHEKALSRLYRAKAELDHAVQMYNRLNDKWNALVRRINKLGGEEFLSGGERKTPAQFSADDLQRLIQLCHPDKHDGKPLATEMTQKLLKMKDAIHG